MIHGMQEARGSSPLSSTGFASVFELPVTARLSARLPTRDGMQLLASFCHLVQVIRHGLKKYRPGLIEGCLAGTGLALEPGKISRISKLTIF